MPAFVTSGATKAVLSENYERDSERAVLDVVDVGDSVDRREDPPLLRLRVVPSAVEPDHAEVGRDLGGLDLLLRLLGDPRQLVSWRPRLPYFGDLPARESFAYGIQLCRVAEELLELDQVRIPLRLNVKIRGLRGSGGDFHNAKIERPP